jgi:hypothetical protein
MPKRIVCFKDAVEEEAYASVIEGLERQGALVIGIHGSSLHTPSHRDIDVYALFGPEAAEVLKLNAGGSGTKIERLVYPETGFVFDIRRTTVPFSLSDVGRDGKPFVTVFQR